MILYTIVVAFQQKSDPEESPEEIKSREMELGIESWTCLLLQLFLNSSATNIVLVTMFRTAVETVIA